VFENLLLGVVANFITKLIERSPRWLTQVLNRPYQKQELPAPVQVFPVDCGDKGISLSQQKLLISTTFGPYFADLLQRDHAYVDIPSQIDAPSLPGQQDLAPLQRIFAAFQYPRGQRVILIAADGGMGKSTLAARIVRCLYQEQAVDMILGDSAKKKAANVLTGLVADLEPGLYNVNTLVTRLCSQLGIPSKPGKAGRTQAQRDIRDRLAGRRAVIVVDNLESIPKPEAVVDFLCALASRDVRIMLTTRSESGLTARGIDIQTVHLKPVRVESEISKFLAWHIATYTPAHPDLAKLTEDLENHKRMRLLADHTGGVPLMMQLLASDVARSSWQRVEQLPNLFGRQLLEFLYEERWNELSSHGVDGQAAMTLLAWVAREQIRQQTITLDSLVDWASLRSIANLDSALRLLFERFLIVNNDTRKGRFVLFPSLVEFMQAKDLLEGDE
jgi:hypothetical protein